MSEPSNLGDILDLDVLQKIQDSFAEATGLAAIIVDREGNSILEYSNFTPYCTKVREEEGCEGCAASDALGGKQSAQCMKPQIYLCHKGLVDMAVPIFLADEYVGAILAGQARIEPEIMEVLKSDPNSKMTNWEKLFEDETRKALYDTTHRSSYKKIREAARLMYTIANYLTELAHVNRMQQELHEKDMELVEEVKRRSQTEAALMEADLKALQAQINPHFLFNVLNTIGRVALLERAEKTQELIYQFSDLMRYNLKQNMAVAESVRESLDYVKTYLSIQSCRLAGRLRYEINADEDTLDCLIPVMTIQPFIENVINYVVEPRAAGGELKIRVSRSGGFLDISIEDNGPGMDEETVSRILSGSGVSGGKSTGIGISNVDKRLKYYFGQEYGVRIKSRPGEGTRILIHIPDRSVKE